MQKIDQSGGEGLQIIGAGLSRTGTSSLKIALEILQFGKVHHEMTLVADGARSKEWYKASVSGIYDYQKLLSGFTSAIDMPCAERAVELSQEFPNAKVILTVRDPKSWWASMENTVIPVTTNGNWYARTMPFVVFWNYDYYWFNRYMFAPNGCTNYQVAMKSRGVRDANLMNRWTAHIQASIPAERLLIFESKEGWAPLCKFLDVPIPDVPYPRAFPGSDFEALISGLRRDGMKKWGYLLLASLIPMIGAYTVFYRFLI